MLVLRATRVAQRPVRLPDSDVIDGEVIARDAPEPVASGKAAGVDRRTPKMSACVSKATE